MDGGAGKTELMMMMRSCNFQEKKKKISMKEEEQKEAEFTRLPWDLVLLISRYVVSPRDRLSFRSVNRLLRSAIPSSLTDFFLKREEQAAAAAAAACFSDDHHHHHHPWLIRHESCNPYRMMMMKEEEYHAYTLLDPWHGVGDKYFLNLPGSSSSYAAAGGGSIIYCNEDWCVIVQPMTTSIFLWNPFTKEKITITLPHHHHLPSQQLLKSISACSFLNSPHSPHFQLFLLCFFSRDDVFILIFENKKWRICFMPKYAFKPPSSYSQFRLLNGQADFYLVDTENGRVWHLDRSKEEEKCPKFPNLPDYSRSYLVKCEEDLLAVVIDVEEDDVHVFKLQSNSNWVAVNNLDEFVLYISHYSSFSRRVTVQGEGNRIYFPRFDYDGKLLYYSLHSKRYHHHHHHSVGGGDHQPVSAAGLIQQVTRNQIVYNAWIQPRWC